MLNNLNSERIMEAREIYHVLKSIVEPIHTHSDQMVAIAKWIEAEFDYKPQKQANGAGQSTSNCNIPLVSNSVRQEIERRRDMILSEPDGTVREQMIQNLALDL